MSVYFSGMSEIQVQHDQNITLVVGVPSQERDQILAEQVASSAQGESPLFILDIKGTLVPLLLERGIPFAAVASLEEVPSVGAFLVINDGEGYLKLVTTPELDISPKRVIASVDALCVCAL